MTCFNIERSKVYKKFPHNCRFSTDRYVFCRIEPLPKHFPETLFRRNLRLSNDVRTLSVEYNRCIPMKQKGCNKDIFMRPTRGMSKEFNEQE